MKIKRICDRPLQDCRKGIWNLARVQNPGATFGSSEIDKGFIEEADISFGIGFTATGIALVGV